MKFSNETLLCHQDWVQPLLFPPLLHQRQILQELYKTKLNSKTQFSHTRGVTGQPMFYWLHYTENIGENSNNMQHVPNTNTICWRGGGMAWGPLRLSQLAATSKAWTTAQVATAKWYTDFHSAALRRKIERERERERETHTHTHTQTPPLSLSLSLSVIPPLYNTKDKSYKSCIKQNWTAKHNFHIHVGSQGSLHFVDFIILQT